MRSLQLERRPGAAKGERNIVAVRDVPLPSVTNSMVLVKVR